MRYFKLTCILLFAVLINFPGASFAGKTRDGFPVDSSEYTNFYRVLNDYLPGGWKGDNIIFGENLDPLFIEQWVLWMMEEEMIPGISMGFMKEGELYWKRNLGKANVEQNIPVSDETTFITGSISKTIVVTAAMQLYEEGLFELDDDINDYLPFSVRNPGYPFTPITFRHLMTHLSSINDDAVILENLITYGGDSPVELAEFIEGYMLPGGIYYGSENFENYPPQTEFNYTNAGVSLLAYLVEILSGNNFEEYCQTNIFKPMNMNNVSFLLQKMDSSTIATPYKQVNDTIVPIPHIGIPFYPSGTLRSNAQNLSKILSMYMNDGMYNQKSILSKSSIDSIMTLQFPDIITEEPIGLIWFYKYGFFMHGGSLTGAQSYYGFNRDKRSGLLSMGNSNSEELSWFMEFILLSYSNHYDPLSYEKIRIQDDGGNNLLEPGEMAGLVLDFKNNINISPEASDIKVTLSTEDPNISIIDAESIVGDITYLDTASNVEDPFIIEVGNEGEHYSSELLLTYEWDEEEIYERHIRLEIYPTEILLVNDAKTFGGMFLQPDFWYWHALDSLGYEMYYYDLSLFGDPSAEFLANFPVVIWFTGYHTSNTLTENNQEALASYLDDGGNLFLTGQDISEDLEGTDFLGDYLHVSHVNGAYQGQDTIEGISGDPIGDGIEIMVNQGFGGMYQFSMSELEPIKGGESVFDYFSTGNSAAVRFENDTYKTVFFGFGFEGINSLTTRLEVMQRILDYFDETVGEEEIVKGLQDFSGPFPNPSQDVARFSYSLQESKNITISLYDLNGSLLRSETRNHPGKGHYEISLSVSNLPSGVYFYSISAGNSQNSGKLVVME